MALTQLKNMESAGQKHQSRRKPHKTHRVVANVGGTPNPAAFSADVEFIAVDEPRSNDSSVPPQQDPTRSKPSSEHFKLPEGTIVVQPEDATDSPFQGPEFFPPDSSDSDVAEIEPSPAPSLVQHCTVCRYKLDVNKPDSVYQHSLLKVLLCKRCFKLREGRTSDSRYATRNFCSWCSAGGSLIYCDVCPAKFCTSCVRRNLGRAFLDSVVKSEDDEKWRCFICEPGPLSDVVQSCSEFITECQKASRARGTKRRKSATGNVPMSSPQKQSKSAALLTVKPMMQPQAYRKLAPARGRPAGSQIRKVLGQQATGNVQSVTNGGVVTIRRPEYTADMIVVNEHNVWPVLEKLLAATQSMSMLLGSLKDDLQRTTVLAARNAESAPNVDSVAFDIALKRREASLKLWRAFDAYQKSFVDIEAYSHETGATVRRSESCNASSSSISSSASVNDGAQSAVSRQ